ncbi:uncharacterized protein LOC131148699 isoform X2 [Malania oleifera]|uniref:uncharacterized protein LOC131148699 isoform X2 n=1 Tax=Malania oleifera TaxID=397392 RepID=UPI0025ADB98D|nr:uncharacterized protein LOC131148699 isoform X2 [Malania oleifera]
MFDILFGWRKASKCKKLIRRVQCRLKLLKKKRSSIVRQLRDDMGQLIKTGHEQLAFNRVEQLIKDESIMAADCPNDINEAVSSLIFASARCGDLPELQSIRKLFRERYGHRFAMAAVELLPGNLVNRQVKEKLSMNSVPEDLKYRLMGEIARDCHESQILALEYSSELQQQQQQQQQELKVKEEAEEKVLDRNVQIHYHRTVSSQMQYPAPRIEETEQEAIYVDISVNRRKFPSEPCRSPRVSGITSNSSILLQASPNMEGSPGENAEKKEENLTRLNSPNAFAPYGVDAESKNSGVVYNHHLEHKHVRTAAGYASESSPQFPVPVVYLDDIEEFQSPMTEDRYSHDRRLFMFKSLGMPKREKFENCCHETPMDQYESWNESVSSKNCRKSQGGRKRPRRRSVSWVNPTMKDVEFAIYYGETRRNSSSHNHRSHHRRKHPIQNKISMAESQQFHYAQKRLSHPCCIKWGSNFGRRSCCSCCASNEKVIHCSLEDPCYFCPGDDKDQFETPPWKQRSRLKNLGAFPTYDLRRRNQEEDVFHNGKPYNLEKKWASLPPTPIHNQATDAVVHNSVTSPDLWVGKKSNGAEGELKTLNYLGSCASSSSSFSRGNDPGTRKERRPSYLRAVTMPSERPKDRPTDNILRSSSFPFQHLNPSPGHVHPKLPDYEELEAKFTALRKEYLQNKHH